MLRIPFTPRRRAERAPVEESARRLIRRLVDVALQETSDAEGCGAVVGAVALESGRLE